jgi:hypothetical protein
MKNERLEAALTYVRRGFEIFPVPPGTKAGYSVASRGFNNGQPWGKTTDEAEVRKYWARLPQANIGIPMGIGSGIFDIECDTKEGHPDLVKDGAESLAELEQQYGKLPATLMFVSPSGSVHRLFKHPGGDIRIRSGALDAKNYPGIDCKGDGGMSVAPPSRTSKGVYRWINKRRIAAAPAWLIDMVVKPASASRESNVWTEYADSLMQPASLAEVTLAMVMIPNDDRPWDSDKKNEIVGWNTVGMALFAATGGSAEGLKLFDAWSRRSIKYNAARTIAKWQAFGRCPPREITAGSIFHWADEAVPGWEGRMYYDASVIALIDEFLELMDE